MASRRNGFSPRGFLSGLEVPVETGEQRKSFLISDLEILLLSLKPVSDSPSAGEVDSSFLPHGVGSLLL